MSSNFEKCNLTHVQQTPIGPRFNKNQEKGNGNKKHTSFYFYTLHFLHSNSTLKKFQDK